MIATTSTTTSSSRRHRQQRGVVDPVTTTTTTKSASIPSERPSSSSSSSSSSSDARDPIESSSSSAVVIPIIAAVVSPDDDDDDDVDECDIDVVLQEERRADDIIDVVVPSPSSSPDQQQQQQQQNHHQRRYHRGVIVSYARCYRLNLERPFDIHAEQSPLEYGDYMAPWSKEMRPLTYGPTEYCPPRHLGGRVDVWRELMARRRGGGVGKGVVRGRGGREVDDNDDGRKEGGEEGKINRPDDPTWDGGGNGREFRWWMRSYESSGIVVLSSSLSSSIRDDGAKKDGEKEEEGEGCPFRAYDMSHVVRRKCRSGRGGRSRRRRIGGGGGTERLDDERSSGAVDDDRPMIAGASLSSEEEEEGGGAEGRGGGGSTRESMADMTARLFRRSELSLREGRAAAAAAAQVERRRVASSTTTNAEGENDDVRRHGGSRARRLLRSLTRAIDGIQGTPLSSGSLSIGGSNPYHHREHGLGVGVGGGILKPEKRSSTQALEIEKARDLVDESDNDDDGRGGDVEGSNDDGSNAHKKPINVSLYIVGEYDILNDLVFDGARRLRDNADSTDHDLLRQNDPCPPPDRRVRPTGWGRCNPSSMYARDPPEDFDWVRYYDKLRIRTGPHAAGRGGVVDSTRSREVVVAGADPAAAAASADDNPAAAEPQDRLSKATGDTQTTESTAPIASSASDLSCDEHHRVNGRLTMVTRAGSDGWAAAALSTIEPHIAPAGGGGVAAGGAASSHFNRPSPPPARAASVGSAAAVDDVLGASIGRSSGSKSRGFGRRMSSLIGGRKKSSGAE